MNLINYFYTIDTIITRFSLSIALLCIAPLHAMNNFFPFVSKQRPHTRLRDAVINGDLPTVQGILDAGDPIDTQDCHHYTPLMYASRNDHVSIVQTLIKARANLDLKNWKGQTASDVASVKTRTLIKAAQQAQEYTNHMENLLFDSVQKGDIKTLRQVLDENILKVDVRDHNNLTPLMLAACYGHENIARLLLEHKAQLNLCNTQGHTALQLADHYKQKEVTDLLRRYQATNPPSLSIPEYESPSNVLSIAAHTPNPTTTAISYPPSADQNNDFTAAFLKLFRDNHFQEKDEIKEENETHTEENSRATKENNDHNQPSVKENEHSLQDNTEEQDWFLVSSEYL